jgi:hypothetical protein
VTTWLYQETQRLAQKSAAYEEQGEIDGRSWDEKAW